MDALVQKRSTARQGEVLKSFAFKAKKNENNLDQGGAGRSRSGEVWIYFKSGVNSTWRLVWEVNWK